MGDRLAIIDMGRKLGAGSLCEEYIPCHACSWDIDAFTGRVTFEGVSPNEKHRDDFEG